MNKKELIERIEGLKNIFGNECEYVKIDFVIELISELDEPQKVVVPQFVADWYEEHKDDFEFNVWDWIAFRDELEKLENKEFTSWINDCEGNPIQILVNMHQFGYEVEKEKRYTVTVKGDIKEKLLVYGKTVKRYFFTKDYDLYNVIYSHTRKQLEEAGFGWVFDCPGIEIEEVKE